MGGIIRLKRTPISAAGRLDRMQIKDGPIPAYCCKRLLLCVSAHILPQDSLAQVDAVLGRLRHFVVCEEFQRLRQCLTR